jgi:hypothetical protein
MRYGAIVLLSITAAVCYGIVHDQITARICIEYFTIGHPNIFGTDNPALLGLGWGIVATWWVGLIVGIPLASAALDGEHPKRSAKSLVRPICILLGIMACGAALAGVAGFLAATAHLVHLAEPLASQVPADRHVRFIAASWIHLGSYSIGLAGGFVLCRQVRNGRKSPRAAAGH